MTSPNYRFPLSIQTVLPADFQDNPEFQEQMRTLQKLGFFGVELNIADIFQTDISEVRSFLAGFDLKMTMFASGLTAKVHSLSLSNQDSTVRKQTLTDCRRIIDKLSGTDTGIIIGFLKGTAGDDPDEDRTRFFNSLKELSPYIEQKRVPTLIEATNRYESSVANTVAETVSYFKDLNNPFLRVLPDTFHMNIEESDSLAAIIEYSAYFHSFHISDNNRHFPGFGALDFQKVFDVLKGIDYQGGIAIEGNIKNSFIEDVRISIEYLSPFIAR